MPGKFFCVLFVLLFAVVPTLAQTQSDDVVRITTNLVQIDAIVTKNGKPIRDLKAEDFEIFEDGRRQEITSFAYISNVADNAGVVPATSSKDPNVLADPTSPASPPTEIPRRRIALVVDDYGLSAQSMSEVRRQTRKFIDEQLNPNDEITIVLTSRAKRVVPHFTNDKSRLNQEWEQLNWNQCSRVGVKLMPRVGSNAGVGCGGVGSYDDSIVALRSVVTALDQVPGRKSMIIFSDDMPLREEERFTRGGSVLQPDPRQDDAHNYSTMLKRVAEMAIRSSVVIYGVDAGGLQDIGLTAADATTRPMVSGSEGNGIFVNQLRNRSRLLQYRRAGAEMIAKQTGGFLVHNQNEFQFDKILEDQSGYYLIGYRPDSETFNKKFKSLRARVKKPGLQVRTRSGFFGLTEDEARQIKEKNK